MSTPTESLVKFFLFGVRSLELLVVFFWEALKANYAVLKLIVSPRLHLQPAIVKVPVDLKSEWSLFFLTQMITLTPGTLSLGVSADKTFVLIHILHSEDVAATTADIKRCFELRLRRLWG